MQRLQTDYIDLYQLHWPSRNAPIFGATEFDPAKERPCVPIEDTLGALQRLIDEGKLRHIGVSNESAWGVSAFTRAAETSGLPRIATIQNLYNLTARGFETALLTETCYRENVGLLAYSPLAFGQLSAKYIDDPAAHGRLDLISADLEPALLASHRHRRGDRLRGAGAGEWLKPGAAGIGLVLFALVRRVDHYRCDQFGAAERKYRCGGCGAVG